MEKHHGPFCTEKIHDMFKKSGIRGVTSIDFPYIKILKCTKICYKNYF